MSMAVMNQNPRPGSFGLEESHLLFGIRFSSLKWKAGKAHLQAKQGNEPVKKTASDVKKVVEEEALLCSNVGILLPISDPRRSFLPSQSEATATAAHMRSFPRLRFMILKTALAKGVRRISRDFCWSLALLVAAILTARENCSSQPLFAKRDKKFDVTGSTCVMEYRHAARRAVGLSARVAEDVGKNRRGPGGLLSCNRCSARQDCIGTLAGGLQAMTGFAGVCPFCRVDGSEFDVFFSRFTSTVSKAADESELSLGLTMLKQHVAWATTRSASPDASN
ncbi:hypothetical protein BU23DRAFT_656284 [Bimuria novae-zelandiae CBS 107.79]|uniref:Uncharacterized protein n=1 Tax=Bimuria novae-zelandiae CBS 107.79 TaxID=1447943 RepID=A0A6A5UVF4_9PLEO|nr:hypothetical protein BU23DRAFT_656284 [Bimuria novae-zelandiae CBS 107.79]